MADDKTAAMLSNLTLLTGLDLRYCPITNEGMALMGGRLHELAYCNVEGCPLTSLGIWRLLCQHKRINIWSPGGFSFFPVRVLSAGGGDAECCPCPCSFPGPAVLFDQRASGKILFLQNTTVHSK
jgi:hypothetical protein